MAASMYAVIISGGIPLQKRINLYSKGAGTGQMMLMIWIFILAGAFANTAKVMGSIDATVNAALTLLPGNMLLAGLFMAACFISISVGTSVGTIVALTPIAAGVAQQTETSIPLMTAVVVGGSFFGDNLSFISDTTIVATSTQGCKLSDKFRVNSFIVVPVAILIFIIYMIMGTGIHSPQHIPDVAFTKVLPYLVVLLTAVLGMNVMAVLTLGILLTGIIGIMDGSYDIYGWFNALGGGIVSMGELIIITMMAGGLLEIIKYNGAWCRTVYSRTGIADRPLYCQQYRCHHHSRRNSQANRRQIWSGQQEVCLYSGYILLYHAGNHSLRSTTTHGCRTCTTEPHQYCTLPLLFFRHRHSRPVQYIV